MNRQRLVIAAIVVVVVIAGVRLAVTRTPIYGYRVIDDYNVAVQVTGANPT